MRLPTFAPFYRALWPLVIGVACGALSWFAAHAVSGSFEPYDSSIGLAANQLVLCLPAMLLACKPRLVPLLVYFLGAWLGMNTYAYAFGGSEQRAWAMLGAVTSLVLFFWPVVLAVVTVAIRYIWSRWGAARGLHSQSGK